MSLLPIIYGISDNAGIQEALEDSIGLLTGLQSWCQSPWLIGT